MLRNFSLKPYTPLIFFMLLNIYGKQVAVFLKRAARNLNNGSKNKKMPFMMAVLQTLSKSLKINLNCSIEALAVKADESVYNKSETTWLSASQK